MKSALLITLLLATTGLGIEPFYDKVTSDEFSPQSDILVQHYFAREGGTDQIWLVSTADPSHRCLLFTHERHAEVIFSPDEQWLVINDHFASNESRLLLYRRKQALDYEQVADLRDAAWQFFDQLQDPARPHQFDHSYVDALRWADDDPPTLLLCLNGHMDHRHHTSEWYCFYDVQAKAFSVDLAAHNRKNTTLESN